MQRRLGWLAALTLVFLAGGGWAEPNVSEPEAAAESASPQNEGYRFDADRFGRAMDRAAGSPTAGSTETDPPALANTSLTNVLGRTLLSLLAVVGIIYGLTYALRRLSAKTPFQAMGPLRVLAKQGLSQKSNVYVVSALNRFLIIGESSQGLTCLSEFTDPEEVEELRREWGWDVADSNSESARTLKKNPLFAPALKSHMDDLERELRSYEEVRR